MMFQFAPAIQAEINSGVYEVVRNAVTGELIGVARRATGEFVALAIGMVTEAGGLGIDPLLTPPQLATGGLQLVQTQIGFQKQTAKILDLLQARVGVLQATTEAIGVGSVADIALSAVNLHQVLKLREKVKQRKLEVKDGFFDWKALKDQKAEIIQQIQLLAKEVEFKQHRTILVQAYGRFVRAIADLKDALQLADINLRNAEIENARGIFCQALADYARPELLAESCCARLRRQECVWAIEQAIAIAYQLQGAYEVVSDRLTLLQQKMRQDLLNIIDCCQSQAQLDFIFPEIARIHGHDLTVLKSWQNHINWMQALAPVERQMLASLERPDTDSCDRKNQVVVAVPAEQLLYENLKQQSHYLSLRDRLRFLVQPDLRQSYELYIQQQASASSYQALASSNWAEIPDLTVANLYWYFKAKG